MPDAMKHALLQGLADAVAARGKYEVNPAVVPAQARLPER